MTRRLAIPDGSERISRTRRLEGLFRSSHPRLYRLARRLSGDAEEARDMVQEAFVRLARSATAPLDERGGEAWLVRTVVNLSRDRARRLRVRERGAATVREGAQEPGSPESAAVARVAIETALALLSPRRRAVVVLHELEERDVADIARLLGLTKVTVRWHLSAARKDLKRILLEGGAHEA